MARIDGRGQFSYDPSVLKNAYKEFPHCCNCDARATIWIQLNELDAGEIPAADLFLCETHAFHLARILMQDIGHVKIAKPAPGEPTN